MNCKIPKISVLMSCFNAEHWLNEAIESVLNQTYTNFEFIIVDDGSTDDTLQIVQNYAKQDKRIVVVTKPNTGLTDSLNVGMQRAKGKWIARLDSDDECEPTRFEKQLEYIEKSKNIVLVLAESITIDETGKYQKICKYPTEHSDLVRCLEKNLQFPPHSSAFFKLETVQKIGGYRKRIKRSQDRDLWLRLSEQGQLKCLKEPLVKIRKHKGQISCEYRKIQIIDSRIAGTSYWLRSLGYVDPVEADDLTFSTFKLWLVRQLEETGLFEFNLCRQQLARIKKEDNVSWVIKLVRIILFLVKNPAFVMFLIFQFKKAYSTSNLARKWIAEQTN